MENVILFEGVRPSLVQFESLHSFYGCCCCQPMEGMMARMCGGGNASF